MGLKPRSAPTFFAADRAAWAAWLEANHATASQVRLVFWRKSTGKACIDYDGAVEEALRFGWIDGVKQKLDDRRYCYRFTPRRPGSRWSDSNKRRVAALEAAGRMRPAGAAAVAEAKRSGTWSAPGRAPVPDRVPDELTRALAASPRARRAFEAMPPSHRRNYQRWIAEAVKPETRERRAAKAVEYLLAGGTPW